MKKYIITSIALLAFSVGAMAEVSQSASSANENAADATNAGNFNNVVITDEYYEDGATRDIGGPQQTEVHYSGEYKLKNTPNVTAPGLTTTMTETCMGSTSAGLGMAGFGVSFGTTWRDSACVRRLDARQLQSLGYNLGAKELMCDSSAVAAALKRAGKPCYNDLPAEQKRPEDRVVVAPVAAPAAASW